MARYAIVENGKVANLINWDGVSQYPNSDSLVLAPDNAYIGGDYVDGVFSATQPEEDTRTYGEKRAYEYPSINDLIVALWENVVEERASAVISLEADRQAVKTKYPKP